MKIIFICPGNSCFSSVAEIIMRKTLCDYGVTSIDVSSGCLHSSPTDEYQIKLRRIAEDEFSSLAEKKGYGPVRQPQKVNPEELASSDLIVITTEYLRKEISSLHPDIDNEKIVLFQEYFCGEKRDLFLISFDYSYFRITPDIVNPYILDEDERASFIKILDRIEQGCMHGASRLYELKLSSEVRSGDIDPYVTEYRRFIKSIDEYFDSFNRINGEFYDYFYKNPITNQQKWLPDPTSIIDQMSMIRHPSEFRLRVSINGNIQQAACIGLVSEQMDKLKVKRCRMGALQFTLLQAMAWHVMPLSLSANHFEWNPIFDVEDLYLLRLKKYPHDESFHKSFMTVISKNLPTLPTVGVMESDYKFAVTFYVWNHNEGYLKISSTVTFPKEEEWAYMKDIEIVTETVSLVPSECMFTHLDGFYK